MSTPVIEGYAFLILEQMFKAQPEYIKINEIKRNLGIDTDKDTIADAAIEMIKALYCSTDNASLGVKINAAGIIHYQDLKDAKDIQRLDFKLKEVSISSIEFNKYFPSIAVGVAILAIIVPILVRIFWAPAPTVYKLPEEQVQLLLQEQEKNRQLIHSFHLDLKTLDSSVNSLRKNK